MKVIDGILDCKEEIILDLRGNKLLILGGMTYL